MFSLPFTLFLLSGLGNLVDAGSVNKGSNCSVAHNRLQVGTYQFFSDCDSHTYCDPNTSICELRTCRHDDFPFGYAQDDSGIPPKCPSGQFCPDEMDACQALLPVDSPCQLNRDDQCEPPPNWAQLADPNNRGLNFNGSVCLNNVCMWANATEGQSCTVENTAYIAYGSSGEEFIDIVSRGNCQIGNYCDSQTTKCVAAKNLNEACDADKECLSYNCMSSGKCGKGADQPRHVGVWVYVVVAIAILGGMFGTLITLFIFHRRQRDAERDKRAQYWREQTAFRQNIMQMRETARASILSLPDRGSGANSRRSTLYSRDGHASYDSSAPIVQHAAGKGSGLRHYVGDGNDSGEFDEGIMMQPTQPAEHYGSRF
ncbi:hypothetical protein PLICRDRAFT_27352 [Plicaturopsis crispa FD-325 SS-3]|nr:hypothetical protein PLICRDRAFT_27352 [Plicaturopsis crispa FD-325 SS-3]